MAIKWKNFKEKGKNVGKKLGKSLLETLQKRKVPLVLVSGVLAMMLYGFLFREDLPTSSTWFLGTIFNLLLTPTVAVIVGMWIRRQYRDWKPEDETFYEDWKRRWRVRQRFMLVALGVLLVVATWLLNMRWYNHYYYGNYSVQYLTYFTVLIQCFVAEVVICWFFLKRLQEFMDVRNQIINRKMEENLERALQIERDSLLKVSRSDQLRMDLITNVSHDLKTPLTSMVGYLELLKKEDLNDTAKDYLEVISNRAGKLKEMIESLFSLAKVSSGNVELKREQITMNRLIEQIFADMADKMKDSGLEFVTLLDKGDTRMVTDNGYMYRICQNLLENALKYSAKGTRVFVKTCLLPATPGGKTVHGNQEAMSDGQAMMVPNGIIGENEDALTKDQKICMEITNTAGYQMDFKKEDIVERFARADKARSTEGNGLGLAIVSTYAAALGGEFDIFIDYDQFKARLVFPREMAVESPEAEA